MASHDEIRTPEEKKVYDAAVKVLRSAGKGSKGPAFAAKVVQDVWEIARRSGKTFEQVVEDNQLMEALKRGEVAARLAPANASDSDLASRIRRAMLAVNTK